MTLIPSSRAHDVDFSWSQSFKILAFLCSTVSSDTTFSSWLVFLVEHFVVHCTIRGPGRYFTCRFDFRRSRVDEDRGLFFRLVISKRVNKVGIFVVEVRDPRRSSLCCTPRTFSLPSSLLNSVVQFHPCVLFVINFLRSLGTLLLFLTKVVQVRYVQSH